MTDFSTRVAKNSFFIYVGRIINLSITFFVFIHLANYLGETSFGRLSVALTYIATFDILANFGLNQIMVRELSVERFSSPTILGSGIIIKLALTLSSVLLAGSIALFLNYPQETIIIIWIVSFNLLISSKLSSTRMVFETFFQAKLRMEFPIIFSIIDHILFAVLIFLGILKYHVNLIGIAWIYTICNIPGAILLLWKFLKSTSVRFYFNYTSIKYLVREAFPLLLYISFSTLNTKIDVLLLSWIKGDADVGYYSAAIRLVYPLLFLSTSLSISLFPLLSRFFQEYKLQFLRILKIGIKFILLISIFLAVTFAFNSKKIISTVYIASFAPSASAFKILILALGLTFLNFYFVDVFIAAKRQKLTTLVMAIALGFNVVLNLIFIPKYGFMGASYTRLFTSLVSFILFYWLLSNRLKLKGIIEYSKIIPLTILFLLPQLAFKNFNLILSLTFSIIIFGGLLLIFKIFTADDLKLFKKFFKREGGGLKQIL